MPNSAALKPPHFALSRRNVIHAAASTALVIAFGTPALALAGKGEAPAGGMFKIDPLALIDESVARAFIGTDFDISSDMANAKLRLTKVLGNLISPKKEQAIITQAFAMEFEVLSNTGALTQETYHTVHPKLGEFDLFLVPYSLTNGKRVLVATFNRLK